MSDAAPEPGGAQPEMSALFLGAQGPKGDKGDKGDKGEQGESHLAASAEELVATLVKAKAMPKWMGYSQGVVIFVLAAVIAVLVFWIIPSVRNDAAHTSQQTSTVAQQTQALENYVRQYAQHGCQALELITATPVSKPADPSANPSREINYKFYEALLYWEHKDGCKP